MRLTGSLHGMMKMRSVTYPRPLYYEEDDARRAVVEQTKILEGTAFHAVAWQNVEAAEEIERMFREQGPSDRAYRLVDEYIEALLGEYDALRLYPEIPPLREPQQPSTARFVAGGR